MADPAPSPFNYNIFRQYVPALKYALQNTIFSKDASHLENFYTSQLNPLNMDLPYFKYNKDTHVVEYDPTHPYFRSYRGYDLIPTDRNPMSISNSPGWDGTELPSVNLMGMIQPRYRTLRDLYDSLAGKSMNDLKYELVGRSIPDHEIQYLSPVEDARYYFNNWLSNKLPEIIGLDGTSLGDRAGHQTFGFQPPAHLGLKKVDQGYAELDYDKSASVFLDQTVQSLRNFLNKSMTDSANQVVNSAKYLHKKTGEYPIISPFGRDQEYANPYYEERMKQEGIPLENLVPLEINRNVGGSGHGPDLYLSADRNEIKNEQFLAQGNGKYTPLYQIIGRSIARMMGPQNAKTPKDFYNKVVNTVNVEDQERQGFLSDVLNRLGNKDLRKVLANQILESMADGKDPYKLLGMTKTSNQIAKAAPAGLTASQMMWHVLGQDSRAARLFNKYSPAILTDTGFAGSVMAALRASERFYNGLRETFGRASNKNAPVGAPTSPWDTQMTYANAGRDDWMLKNRIFEDPNSTKSDVHEAVKAYDTVDYTDSHGEGTFHRVGKTVGLHVPNSAESPGEFMKQLKDFISPLFKSTNRTIEAIKDMREGNTGNGEILPAWGQTIFRYPQSPEQVTFAHGIPGELETLKNALKTNPDAMENPTNILGEILDFFGGHEIPLDWKEKLTFLTSQGNKAAEDLIKKTNTNLYSSLGISPETIKMWSEGNLDISKLLRGAVRQSPEAIKNEAMRSSLLPAAMGIQKVGEEIEKKGFDSHYLTNAAKGTAKALPAAWIASKIPYLAPAMTMGDLSEKYLPSFIPPEWRYAGGYLAGIGAEAASAATVGEGLMAKMAWDTAEPWMRLGIARDTDQRTREAAGRSYAPIYNMGGSNNPFSVLDSPEMERSNIDTLKKINMVPPGSI